MGLYVIALGGNALERQGEIPSSANQQQNIKNAINKVCNLVKDGHKVVITHGNGPQVGRMLVQNENNDSEQTPAVSFDVVDAMSQAYIGYQIEQTLVNELNKQNINNKVIALITQVLVDEDDPGFKNPTKPIGKYYSLEESEEVAKEKKYIIKADSNRGYRRVVASPQPKQIVELDTIKDLVANNNIVVCCGGGGIPVINCNEEYVGIPAIIDKDKTSALLAKNLKADGLIILTAVDSVYINYGKENEESLNNVTCKELEEYIVQEQFAKGSMLPKIEACIDFVKETNNQAIITSLELLSETLNDKNVGTHITY